MELKSVHEIFNNRILRIPSYQRGYTWSNSEVLTNATKLQSITGQLKDLWDDLMNVQADSWHYTGLLTLDKVPEEYKWLPYHKQYAIVDGQQRITSILILISVVVEMADSMNIIIDVKQGDEKFRYLFIDRADARAFVFCYEEDNPSDKYFKKHILNVDEVEDQSRESVYTENLKNAKTFFRTVVSNYTKGSAERLSDLYTLITSSLRFNEYVLPNELDEYVVFETMNNRGKPLSELEKLKNRLMYLNSKLPLPPDAQNAVADDVEVLKARREALESDINTGWITVYNSLGAHKSRPLNDEDFLKNHWIAYFDRYDRSESAAYSKFLFDQHFILPRVYDGTIRHRTIHDYVKSLQKASVVWNKLNNPAFFNDNEATFREVLRSLHRVGLRPSFKPLVMAILLRPDRDTFVPVLRLLEEYSFKIFHVCDRQSNTGDSKLYRLAYQVYQASITISAALADIQWHLNVYYNFNLFKNQVIELFESGNRTGFYNWSGKFYFLFEYDLYLRRANATSSAASLINWQDFVHKKTIEHIYPQSAAAKDTNIEWPGFDGYTAVQRMRLCGSIGNLLAISHSDNSSLNDDPFLFKVDQSNKGEKYRNRGYKYDSMSARIVANQTEWTPECIVKRGISMLDFLWIKLHAGVPNALTYNDKLDLLGLPFLKPQLTESDVQK